MTPNIPPGHYRLLSMALADVEMVGEGDTTFDVSNADVTLYDRRWPGRSSRRGGLDGAESGSTGC